MDSMTARPYNFNKKYHRNNNINDTIRLPQTLSRMILPTLEASSIRNGPRTISILLKPMILSSEIDMTRCSKKKKHRK